MSGLYNAVFGENPAGRLLVGLLQAVQPVEVGRYRDAWVEHDGDVVLVRVHTRNGGGNRECWCGGEPCTCTCPPAIESMRSHPWYVRDADNEYDYTYADFYFKVDLGWVRSDPELGDEVAGGLVALALDPVDVGARWRAAIDAIGKGSTA